MKCSYLAGSCVVLWCKAEADSITLFAKDLEKYADEYIGSIGSFTGKAKHLALKYLALKTTECHLWGLPILEALY